jgi:hypothetical protein
LTPSPSRSKARAPESIFSMAKNRGFFFKSGKSFKKIFSTILLRGTRLQIRNKNFEGKIAKFEAGEFKNRFFPCYFEILENTASTRRRIEPSLSVRHWF